MVRYRQCRFMTGLPSDGTPCWSAGSSWTGRFGRCLSVPMAKQCHALLADRPGAFCCFVVFYRAGERPT